MKKSKLSVLLCCILCLCTITFCACNSTPDVSADKNSTDNTLPNSTSTDSIATENASTDSTSTEKSESNKDNDNTTNNDPDENANPTLEKLEGTIFYSTGFSEGKALVGILENTSSLFCINKSGEVVCELKNTGWNSMLDEESPLLHNGLIYIAQSLNYGVFGDDKGNVITPEQKNVSKFNPTALENGYIIADICDDNNVVIKRGIMNTSFEWVVEPNEALADIYLNSQYDICHTDYVYSIIDNKTVNLKTGEISDTTALPSPYDLTFKVKFDNGAATITFYKNKTEEAFKLTGLINFFEIGSFSYGKTALYFLNPTTETYSFSMIDTNGNILFEPIELGSNYKEVVWDDTCIIYQQENEYNEADKFYSYDFSGNLLGTANIFGIGETKGEIKLVKVSDSTVVICAEAPLGHGVTSNRVYIYDKTFQLLFQTAEN